MEPEAMQSKRLSLINEGIFNVSLNICVIKLYKKICEREIGGH